MSSIQDNYLLTIRTGVIDEVKWSTHQQESV